MVAAFAKRLKNSYRLLDRDARERRERDEANKYNRRAVLGLCALILAAVLYGVLRLLSPPEDLGPYVRALPVEFTLIEGGHVLFDPATRPSELGSGEKLPIRLPERNLQRLPGFARDRIWYEFGITIPEPRFRELHGRAGLLIPRIWGHSEVYIDGQLIDYGKDLRPILALPARAARVQIRLGADESVKFGIRATYPLVAGEIDRLRELSRSVDEQMALPAKIQLAQLIIIALFGVLFLTLPGKPELWTFMLFFVANFAYGHLYRGTLENRLLFGSAFEQSLWTAGADFLRSLLLFRFVLEFFRLSKARAAKLFWPVTLGALLALPALWLVLRRVSGADPWVLTHVALQAYFMIATLGAALWSWSYLALHLRSPARAAMGFVVLAGIAYTFGANLLDFWSSTERLTGEYRNHLLTYFVMAGIVAIEFARTEKDKTELAHNLSREQREKFLRRLGNDHGAHHGFVLLVDAIGFSGAQERIAPEDQGRFSDLVNRRLLAVAARLPRASVLNGTGDGFYFAWETPFSGDALSQALSVARDVLQAEVALGEVKLRFRCALGYGSYYVGMTKAGSLARDYAAGRLLTQLARIIGSRERESNLRVLSEGAAGESLMKLGSSVSFLEGKHGMRYGFIEISDPALPSSNEDSLPAESAA
ncbi:MAG: hypothetical protein NDJ89_14865 [Oligoflexia bacterium]|nr:hypothetical protein [Oligoflexia bacterium]